MPSTITTQFEVPLAVAALRLHLTRAAAYDAVLRGYLVGEIRGGRWYVTAKSIASFSKQEVA